MNTKEQTFLEEAQACYDNRSSSWSEIMDRLEAAHSADDEETEHDLGQELNEELLSVRQMTHGMVDQGDTWELLLSTGGPASRVVVTVDEDGEPTAAVFEFQDWGMPWTPAPEQDGDLLTRWATTVAGFYCEHCNAEAASRWAQ